MKRIAALAGTGLLLAGCGIIDVGASRESEYYEQVRQLEEKVDGLTQQLDDAKARIAELESDEHARFIDAYLASQSAPADQALAAWDAFLADFPASPLGGAAREFRDRTRARSIEQEVVEAEEYRVLLDKLKTAEPAVRKVLIDDFLERFPNTSRKADLENRLESLGEIDALRKQFLDDGTDASATPEASAPAATPSPTPPSGKSGRTQVDVPAKKKQH